MGVNLLNIKTNEPRVALEDYVYLIAGIPKSGKTSLFAKFVEKYFGDPKYGLLLAYEKGYQALRVNAQDITTWEDTEDVVGQLIEHKDKLPYKIIGIDTGDIMWEMSQERVIQEWNASNPTKRTKEISGVGAKGKSDQGYGDGYGKAKKKIRHAIDRLQKNGFGVVILTHSKDKEVEEKNGVKYDQLVCSLPSSARDIFVNMADFIVFLTIEKEQVGTEIVTKRWLYFRTDGYVEAGSRFANVPVRIEYDADAFINVVTEAIKAEYASGTDLNKIREQQQLEREKNIQQYVAEQTEKQVNKSPEELIAEISTAIGKLDKDGKNSAAHEINMILGVENPVLYKKSTDTDKLQLCLEAIKAL